MTNEQLVIRIKAGEDVAGNMEQLYSQVRRFIHTVAWKYRDSGELEDLEQEGYLALYPAIDGYGSLYTAWIRCRSISGSVVLSSRNMAGSRQAGKRRPLWASPENR